MKASLCSGEGWSLHREAQSEGEGGEAISLVIEGGGPQTLRCIDGTITVRRAACTESTGSGTVKSACSCVLKLQEGGEGILEDISIRSNSRIQEIYTQDLSSEKSYVATCKGEKHNPSENIFTTHLPSSISLRRFSQITVRFLSIKGSSSDTLYLDEFIIVLKDLRMKPQASKPSNPNARMPTDINNAHFIPGMHLSSQVDHIPSLTPSSSVPSEFDSFHMFAMYKSILMTEVGQMLDAKLGPINRKLQNLEERLDSYQSQFLGNNLRELQGIKSLLSDLLSTRISDQRGNIGFQTNRIHDALHSMSENCVLEVNSSEIAQELPNQSEDNIDNSELDIPFSMKIVRKRTSDIDGLPSDMEENDQGELELVGDMKRLLGLVKEAEYDSTIANAIDISLPQVVHEEETQN